MFAKLAQLQAFASGRVASMPGSLVHANDNWPNSRRSKASSRSQRPTLVCRWQRAPGDGRLECRWHIEPGDDAPSEEPGESPTLSRLLSLLGTSTLRALDDCSFLQLPALETLEA
jgi:hypothetical protein